MRDHSNHIQLTRDEGVKKMLAELHSAGFDEKARKSVERISLTEAFGRVLAQDIVAKTDVPNALTCRMDSVALHWEDFANLAEGELPDTSKWVRGKDWQFANTGIAMPKGFDTAIVIENVKVSDDEQSIEILALPSKCGAGTSAVGSKMKRGDVVLNAGCKITPDVAATISSAGYSSVLVVRRPRVSFLPTGNELVPANLPFSPSTPDFYAGYGHVFESNSILTRGRVEQWGGTFTCFDIVPDDYEQIKAAIVEAVNTSDIVVLNAGSSKGSDDWSVEVLDELGKMIYHQVSHGPGHHSFAAIVDGTPVIGISGPPGGASFTLGFYLRPVMNQWLGLDTEPTTVQAKLSGTFGKNHFARKNIESMKPVGENRPPEATGPNAKFTSVRFVRLNLDEDGTLLATPVERGELPPTEIENTAIFMLESGPDDNFPKEGDMITVELR